MVIIATGDLGVGKTTVCRKFIALARDNGYRCGGVVTYKTRSSDIAIEDIQTGETRDFARTHNIYH